MKKLLLALVVSTAFLGCGKEDSSIHLSVCNCDHHQHKCVCKDGECVCPNCPEHKDVKPCPTCK